MEISLVFLMAYAKLNINNGAFNFLLEPRLGPNK